MKKRILLAVSIAAFLKIAAQVGPNTPWVWKKGSDIITSSGSYGSVGVESPTNSPIGRSIGSTFVDVEQNLWFFGGFSYWPAPLWWYFNDMWKYNPVTNNWTWMKGKNIENQPGSYGIQGVEGPTNNPGARGYSVYWTDTNGYFWIFGGEGYDRLGNYGALNDLWRFNVATNNWAWMGGSDLANDPGNHGTQGVPSNTNYPPARGSAVSWMDNEGNFWLFGGYDESYFLMNDVWKYSPLTNQWTWMNGSPYSGTIAPVYGVKGTPSPLNTPGSRAASTAWKDDNNNMFLFGGYTSYPYAYYNDMWKYSIATNQWTWVNGSSLLDQPSVAGLPGIAGDTYTPGARQYSTAFKDMVGNLWLFGGAGYSVIPGNYGSLNDLWKYSPAANQWALVKGGQVNAIGIYGTQGVPSVNNRPGSRAAAMGWSDASGSFWLFAGWGYDGFNNWAELNDLWNINYLSLVPARLLSFTGKRQQEKVRLQWEATELMTTSKFSVERSMDQTNFEILGEVDANVHQHIYHFVDTRLSSNDAVVFYRLKIKESDGSYTYSKIVSILPEDNIQLNIYPNPASSIISFTITTIFLQQGYYEIIDPSGKTVIRRNNPPVQPGRKIEVDISHLAKGTYFVRFVNGQQVQEGKFIKF